MKKKVLLIDDNSHEFLIFKRKFKEVSNSDFEITYVSNYKDFKTKLELENYELIFIDFYLGAITGVEVLEYLKKIGNKSFKILLTGSADETTLVEAFRLGLDDYINKSNLNQTELNRLLRHYWQIEKEKSEKEALEKQILHSQKLESLGVMAGGIAHDFNNILTAIMGNSSLGLIQKDTAVKNESFKKISACARRAGDLCNLMLAYSGKGNFKIVSLSLNETIREIGSLFRVTISKKIKINYYLSQKDIVITGDSAQISQLLMNLVSNAAEAIKENTGYISIKTGIRYCDKVYIKNSILTDGMDSGNYAYVEVTDNGSGMSKKTINKIFDPFFTTKFTGRGLGLSAVLGIVKAHNGSINVYSEEGHGTSIKVIFPVTEESVNNNQVQQTVVSAKELTNLTILVADDEAEILNTIHSGLEYFGCQVITAFNGKDALETYNKYESQINLIITDLMMPELSGAELLAKIRSMNDDIPIIIMSGYSEEEVSARYIGKGQALFLQKPFEIQGLVNLIKSKITVK